MFGTKNPFEYGTIVTNERFVDRVEEIAELATSIKLGESVILRSPNGMGKSSLLAELARRQSKESIFVSMDLTGITDETNLLELITRETMNSAFGRVQTYSPEAWEQLTNRRLRRAVVEGIEYSYSKDSKAKSASFSERRKMDSGEHARLPDTKSRVRMCPRCGLPLKWMERYSRHYCYSCKKYAPVRRTIKFRGNRSKMPPIDEMKCPRCGDNLRFVHRYSEYYCEGCSKYPLMEFKRKVSAKPTMEDLIQAFDLPERIANQKGTRVVVMLDEFQEIAAVENPMVLQTMRQRFEMHGNVSYIFAGSNEQTLHRIFREKYAPFVDFAHWIELGPVPDTQLEKFLMSRFADAKGRISKDVADLVIGVSGGYPYYAQKIAHELFHASPSPTLKQAEDAVISVLKHQSTMYSVLWESIKSPLHRKYLLASANEPRIAHGEDFVRRHDLRSRSHVQRTEKQLEMRGIISDGEITDPMFVLWLRSTAYK